MEDDDLLDRVRLQFTDALWAKAGDALGLKVKMAIQSLPDELREKVITHLENGGPVSVKFTGPFVNVSFGEKMSVTAVVAELFSRNEN